MTILNNQHKLLLFIINVLNMGNPDVEEHNVNISQLQILVESSKQADFTRSVYIQRNIRITKFLQNAHLHFLCLFMS